MFHIVNKFNTLSIPYNMINMYFKDNLKFYGMGLF